MPTRYEPAKKKAGVLMFTHVGAIWCVGMIVTHVPEPATACLGPPKGGCDAGETPTESAMRELREEVGVTLTGGDIFEVPNSKLSLTCVTVSAPFESRDSDENSQIVWVPVGFWTSPTVDESRLEYYQVVDGATIHVVGLPQFVTPPSDRHCQATTKVATTWYSKVRSAIRKCNFASMKPAEYAAETSVLCHPLITC
jgi:8-oxo-dGTP pyrophosphatase MutT (NUDIX family)